MALFAHSRTQERRDDYPIATALPGTADPTITVRFSKNEGRALSPFPAQVAAKGTGRAPVGLSPVEYVDGYDSACWRYPRAYAPSPALSAVNPLVRRYLPTPGRRLLGLPMTPMTTHRCLGSLRP